MRFRVRYQTPWRQLAPRQQRLKQTIRTPICTLYQGDTSIKWVNVLFEQGDHIITDLQLLKQLESNFTEAALKHETTVISSAALMPVKPYYVSIQVTGAFGTHEDILRDAAVTVKRWIRDLPIRGLPFSRRTIFKREMWKQNFGSHRLRW